LRTYRAVSFRGVGRLGDSLFIWWTKT
jgi:hypothetical protein